MFKQLPKIYVERVMGYYDRLCYFSGIVGKVKPFVSLQQGVGKEWKVLEKV